MGGVSVADIAASLRASDVFANKCCIRAVDDAFASLAKAFGVANGDDAAAIPDGDGYLLLAAEGILPSLVSQDPYLAGRCAVLANVNDIYAMGGRPLAMVDVIGSSDEASARDMCRGMRDNAERFRVPIVGGHMLRSSADPSLALAILGRAKRLITSFDARPGDTLVLVTKREGMWIENCGFWNCTLEADDATLVPNLELLPWAAETGLVAAGKDVSMAGISGTAVMLAEGSGVGARLNLSRVVPPESVDLISWLLAFLSYGFLLAVAPERLEALLAPFREQGLWAMDIGVCTEGSRVVLDRDGDEALLWDWADTPFTGFGKP